MTIAKLDWNAHNRAHCVKHGVSIGEIEALFVSDGLLIRPDVAHSLTEQRSSAIGRTAAGRYVFVVFTFRELAAAVFIRPISARYMHEREVERIRNAGR